ncbi:hypothetical protein BABINDRAFT_10634, partial [Babjeviella inositovora NRRL Y-12698]
GNGTVTVSHESTTVDTITSCGPEVTNCPASSHAAVSTFVAGANKNGAYAAAAAVAAAVVMGL